MKEFISKWSNWWILSPKHKQLDDAFEKELNELIEREVALRIHGVVGQSKQFKCEKCGSDWGEVRATCFSCNYESEDLST